MIPKASPNDFAGRFREIIADPINLLIERHPSAGTIEDGCVTLHNANKVAASGPLAYYGKFSEILVCNRGVHEPVEEFVFQCLMKVMPDSPTMIELGAYWGHYSMWLKKVRPSARTILVEPEAANLEAGKANYARNGYDGEFIQDFVGDDHFGVDAYLAKADIGHLNILHSDIQGYELQMLEGARVALSEKKIDYVFVSTHSQNLHTNVKAVLQEHGYRIEVDSDFDNETTSFDGLVFASSPTVNALLPDLELIGRQRLCYATAADLVEIVLRYSRL